jgi:hypothetical protein
MTITDMRNATRLASPIRNDAAPPVARTASAASGARGRLAPNGSALTRRTSLLLPPNLPLTEWRRLGQQIHVIADSSAWWLGDWLIYGQDNYPDRYKRAAAETSLDYQTLRNYAWVARKIAPVRRREKLSFQHHAEVAGLPTDEQDTWLTRAEAASWTRNQLRRQIRAGRRRDEGRPEVALVQMNVVAERQQRWQKAAESADMELLAWIVLTLDQAADGAPQAG